MPKPSSSAAASSAARSSTTWRSLAGPTCAAGALRTHLRLDMARRSQHPRAARRHQHQPPPALHDEALQGAGDGNRPGLRHLPAGIALSRPDRGPRASASPAGGQGEPLQHELPRGEPRRGRAAASAGQLRRHPLHHVRTRRRQRRSLRRHRTPTPPARASAARRSTGSPRSPQRKPNPTAAGSSARTRARSGRRG